MSVLSKFKKSDVILEPFPHIVAENVLDEDLCKQLLDEFPPLETVTGGKPYSSNQRFSYSAAESLRNPCLSPVWREFVQKHVSSAFFGEFVNLFADSIRSNYPQLERELSPLAGLRTGLRKQDDYTGADVLLEAQIAINTPVTGKPTSVRGAHLDLPDKLYAGLFYLRHPDDTSTGGDLQIFRVRPGKRLRLWDTHTTDDYVEEVRFVAPRTNTLVFFLNTDRSLHGVTVRSQTSSPRCFLNLVAEVEKPLFDLRQFDGSFMQRSFQRMKRALPAFFRKTPRLNPVG
jgi:hypothetical protein